MYFGSDKQRFRFQRFISLVLLAVSVFLLITNGYSYLMCGGAGYPVFKAVICLCVGFIMLYFSKRW
ncbi:hypothetical protein RYB01_19035 [Pseudomonas syringae]|nr:hypothetical protein [Pseudomonas syringae]